MGEISGDAVWHMLDFFCDDHDSCALTVWVHKVRFHIIADGEKLDGSTEVGAEYRKLLRQVRGVENKSSAEPGRSTDDTDTDSGVDVNEDGTKYATAQEDTSSQDPEATLQAWMFAPLSANLDTLAPLKKSKKPQTLQEWYHCPTRFCELVVAEGGQELEAIELENMSELNDRIDALLPTVTLPKYVTNNTKVPWYHASDLAVLEASDQPIGTPYHPCRVRHNISEQVFFLKVADNNQLGPMKRELHVLNRMKRLDLHKQMRVPVLEGLVAFDEDDTTPTGKKKIMGFLQTDIPSPTPLTAMFDSSVPKKKRDYWAKEAERMKDILHQNKIVWGDAKADNFMVDENENLWIIDFGGSYTEGWVDPELNETEAGDDMGTTKIINALKDPIANVCSEEDDDVNPGPTEAGTEHGKKRKRSDRGNDSADVSGPSEKRNRSTSDDG